jgi:predicted ATPase/class 3 adenylate cyclase
MPSVDRELPAGTVTFLFTDVEGSTKLLDELGAESYAAALAEHRRLVRDACAGHGGVEVDTQGDAFFIAFATAPAALEAARDAQAALGPGPIRVRMGLHTGTPLLTDEGYVGSDVHRAARIAAAGTGGQVLVSQATAALVDAELRDLGEHRLKDLASPERLYQLGDEDFPPVRSLFRTNLPVPPTPFVGRERELDEVIGLARIAGTRLLTLTGPGGSGKTRLALQAAAELGEDHEHGVWWISLAPIRNPDLVLDAAARALDATGALADHVADRSMLLVLDNFEQVVAAAPQVAQILTACPRLRLIVTSREPLRLSGEQEYAVPPFAHAEGVGFFLGRARAARPDFQPDDAVEAICRRLDDLPLALELAAARVKALTSHQILERLERRLPLLTGGARDLPERQRTLRNTIAWSHDLLADEEARAFRRLSVFAGGCALDAAEAVCEADLEVLASLVDKSLLRQSDGRYSMLETIREFADERLGDSAEEAEIRRRHLDFYLRLAESAGLYADVEASGRHDLVLPEQDNVRSALDWALTADEIELGLQLAVALEQYWVTVAPVEGTRYLEALLARDASVPAVLRARALRVYGGTLFIFGRFEDGIRHAEAALAEFRAIGDTQAVAHMLFRLAVDAFRTGDLVRARELCDESLALHRSPWAEAQVLSLLGDVAFKEGRHEEALDLLRESGRLAEESEFRWWQAHSLLHLGQYALMIGRPDEAREPTRDALQIAHAIRDRLGISWGLAMRAWLALTLGQSTAAGRSWGALEAEHDRQPFGQWELLQDEIAPHVLGAAGADFERGREQGRRLTLEAAVSESLDSID